MSEEDKKEVALYYGKYPRLKDMKYSRADAKLLAAWMDDGKPGLAKSKGENMAALYIMGYSCREINKWFPVYDLELLLYARYQYEWDRLRNEYNEMVQKDAVRAAEGQRNESIRLLSDIMSATHMKWRRELADYLADPDNVRPPNFLPRDMAQYGKIAALLQDVVAPPLRGKPGPQQGAVNAQGLPATPLVSVTVKPGDRDKPDIVITDSTQDDIKKRLIDVTTND
jgi:hypothetical protein